MNSNNFGLLARSKVGNALLAAVLLSCVFASSAWAQRVRPVRPRGYELVDLGAVAAGQASQALSIDEHGTVVGWSVTEAGARRAVIWPGGAEARELGTLQNGTYSFATAISGNGAWVAGNSGIRPLVDPHFFSDIQQGFAWRGDAMQSVGALYNPGTVNKRFGTSDAQAVNDRGQVVGFSIVLRQGLQSAFLWEGGVLTDIGQANQTAFNSRAFDINNAGQVVGDIVLGNIEIVGPQAFLWQSGEFRYLPHPDGYLYSTASAINETGRIVGWSGDGTRTTAVSWSGEDVEEIAALPGDESSQALDVSDSGQVVGWSGAVGQSRAFSWRAGVSTDLNSFLPIDTDWILLEASDLNNRGMIVGSGLKAGEPRAFLLKPVATCR
jgi:probable HAF family extracellular repeat protein